MSVVHNNVTPEDAKSYLSRREIPQLFESLMTGLMYHRPDDHIHYLQSCLEKVREKGLDTVRWNLFIEQRSKTPLPPIPPGSRENGRVVPPPREPSYIQERSDLDLKRNSPLPPIGQSPEPQDSYKNATAPVPEQVDRMALPPCPIVLVLGGPGSGRATQCRKLIGRYPGWVHLSMGDLLRENIFQKGNADVKWGAISDLVSQGEMAPEDVTVDLIKKSIQGQMKATGIIIEGYPRTMGQVREYERLIGRIDLAFVLDCEEYYSTQRLLERGRKTGKITDNLNAIAARLATYKENTLPVIKYYDDQGKLVVVDGDRDADEIFFDLAVLFDNLFYSPQSQVPVAAGKPSSPPAQPRPPSGPKPTSPRRPRSRGSVGRPGSGSFKNVPNPIVPAVLDSGRQKGLPDVPLVFVFGGPGSGTDAQCKKLVAKYGAVHVEVEQNASADTIIAKLKENGSAKAVLLEGYPTSKDQLEAFNKQIGGVSYAVVLDTEEKHMEKHGSALGKALHSTIDAYKQNTLPVIGHLEDQNKLTVINGEQRENEVFDELCKALESHLTGAQPVGE